MSGDIYQGTLFGQGEMFADGAPVDPAPAARPAADDGNTCITASCTAHQARVFWQSAAAVWVHTDCLPCGESGTRPTRAPLDGAAVVPVSAGAARVIAWSREIHGRAGDRYLWGVKCAELLDAHGPAAELPDFPSRIRSTRASRDETARRIFGGAA
jgi:hypothetical protein